MTNDVFTLDENNNAAIRTLSVNPGPAETNSPSVFTEDENGNTCIRVTGSGGGGGDQHNLGYYATPAALREAHPTAEAGDWAIVGSTDTVWIWDTDKEEWVDSDQKGQVTPDMIIVKSDTMPSASTTPAGAVYQFTGVTNSNYMHGYIYENVKTATYTGTVSFEAATLSGTTVMCSGDDFANFLTESGVEPLSVVSGTMTFDIASSLWVLVGKDANNETVLTFQEYQQDYEDAGFTFTGTPQDGDVVAFTCTVEEASASYAWNRIDVQPQGDSLPDQTGNAGKFLQTDGTDASWGALSSKTTATLLANGWSYDSVNSRYEQTVNVAGVTASNDVEVSPYAVNYNEWGNCGVFGAAQAVGTITFWADSEPTNDLQFTAIIRA